MQQHVSYFSKVLSSSSNICRDTSSNCRNTSSSSSKNSNKSMTSNSIYCAATAAVAIALYTGSNCCSMLIISLNILFGCRNISSDTSTSSSSSSMRYNYYCATPTAQAIAMYASSISSTTRSYNIKYLSNNNCIINMNLNYSAVTPTPAIATTYASST